MAKDDSAARARRLIALLRHLVPGEPVSLEAMSSALGASLEDLAEDIATLSLCGVYPYDPYDLVDVSVEGGRVVTHAEVPALSAPVRLSPAEARALAAALQTAGYSDGDPLVGELRRAGGTTMSDAGRTVRSALARHRPGPEGPRPALAGKPDGDIERPPLADRLAEAHAVLAAAVERSEAVRLLYRSGPTGVVSERVVRPLELGIGDGVWYLSAFCESAGAARTFRLDRVLSAEATGERFEPAVGSPAVPAFSADELPVAEVRLAPGVEPAARRWPGASFESLDDGSTLVRVPYSSAGWVARRVVSFLGAAVVLSPEEVRDATRRVAYELAEEHAGV